MQKHSRPDTGPPRLGMVALWTAAAALFAPALQGAPLGPSLGGPLPGAPRTSTGGLRPARTYVRVVAEKDPDFTRLLAARIPGHLDPLDLRCKEAFGAGVIEVGEAIKESIVGSELGIAQAFEGGPFGVREIRIRTRAPAWFPHDYGVGFRFRVTVAGMYRSHHGWHQPVEFPVDLDVLVGEDGLVRADMRPDGDVSVEGAGGAPDPIRQHLIHATHEVADAFGPLELQGMEARVRDRVRAVISLRRPAPGRKQPNPFREVIYAAMVDPKVLRRDRRNPSSRPEKPDGQLDLDGDGRADPDGIRVVNRIRKVERGPLRRGGNPRFDFQSYAGWELFLGPDETPTLTMPDGRIKFVLYGDTDGDGLPDLILVEDKAEATTLHDPFHPVHRAFLRPSVFFLDGQDMARGVFDLGPVRFDFPPGADGSEIRSARLVPRHVDGKFMDWDVELELFDPLGRVLEKGLVFDRYPSNRKRPEEVGFQRAEFAPRKHAPRVRGVKFRVHFAMNKDGLDGDAVKELKRAMKDVGTAEVLSVRLVGHTCEQASFEYNLALARRRAGKVRSWLARQGIHPDKVKVEARGEYDPVASNTSDRGRLMNRRVDGWLLVRPAPPSKPPWYGRVGILGNRDLHPMRRAH